MDLKGNRQKQTCTALKQKFCLIRRLCEASKQFDCKLNHKFSENLFQMPHLVSSMLQLLQIKYAISEQIFTGFYN